MRPPGSCCGRLVAWVGLEQTGSMRSFSCWLRLSWPAWCSSWSELIRLADRRGGRCPLLPLPPLHSLPNRKPRQPLHPNHEPPRPKPQPPDHQSPPLPPHLSPRARLRNSLPPHRSLKRWSRFCRCRKHLSQHPLRPSPCRLRLGLRASHRSLRNQRLLGLPLAPNARF